MKSILLVLISVVVLAYGYRLMSKLDSFLSATGATEEAHDEQRSAVRHALTAPFTVRIPRSCSQWLSAASRPGRECRCVR